MPTNVLNWTKWFNKSPFRPFINKIEELDVEKVRDTDRWFLVTAGFHTSQLGDLTMMYRLIGQISRRLNRDFITILNEDHTPKKEPEDVYFNSLFHVNVDFTSLIVFLGILVEKAARLSHSITVGNRPWKLSFRDWKDKIVKGSLIAPEDFKELFINTRWYETLDMLRNEYTIHHNISIGGVVNKTKFQFISNLDERQKIYDIKEMENLSDDILTYFKDYNDFLCNNFDLLPIQIDTIKL